MAQNKEGKTRLLELAEKTTSDELGITLDTYWLQYGGGDLSDYCKLLAGRLPCVHFKDMKVVGREVRMSAVGDGTLNFEKLLPILADGGTRYVFVEQDNTYGEDPFVCLERSYRYLKSIGLES
jgi:sugar phosphate isomerase/epimerase